MTAETIFSKIIRHEIEADIVFQDEHVTAFRDINPRAPTHILIIPNKVIADMDHVTADDAAILGRMLVATSTIAREQGIAEGGYRLIVNSGRNAHQEVPHLHIHLLGGDDLGGMLP